jgi:hypothetical protein
MTEDFLHYIWKHRLFHSQQLKTTQNVPIHVISSGVHNMNGGPDFLQARVRLGDQLWVGNVEIHIKASHWHQHGHDTDHHYKNVVLHVVYENDAPVHLHQPGDLPVLVLAPYIHEEQWNRYQQWMRHGKGIPCSAQVNEIDDLLWHSFRDALLVERLEQKSQLVLRQLKKCNGDWNEVFYRLLARQFGGKVNADMMELLAERIPYSMVLRLRSDPFQVLALFYGEAGLLDETHQDEYPKELWKEYNFLRHKHRLPPPSRYAWQFFGLRPSGFPSIRIGQFADLLCKGDGLLQQILELSEVQDLKKMYSCQAPVYWNAHTMFDRPRKKCLPDSEGIRIGTDFVHGILINVVTVMLFGYGRHVDDGFCLQRAILLQEQLEVEDNKIIRMWAQLGVKAQHAADAQAMIQLHNQYCEQKRCLECRIGVKILKGE